MFQTLRGHCAGYRDFSVRDLLEQGRITSFVPLQIDGTWITQIRCSPFNLAERDDFVCISSSRF